MSLILTSHILEKIRCNSSQEVESLSQFLCILYNPFEWFSLLSVPSSTNARPGLHLPSTTLCLLQWFMFLGVPGGNGPWAALSRVTSIASGPDALLEQFSCTFINDLFSLYNFCNGKDCCFCVEWKNLKPVGKYLPDQYLKVFEVQHSQIYSLCLWTWLWFTYTIFTHFLCSLL